MSARPVCIVGTNRAASAYMTGLAELGWRVHTSNAVRSGANPMRSDQHSARRAVPHFLQERGNGQIRFFDDLSSAASSSQIVIVAIDPFPRTGRFGVSDELTGAIELLSAVSFDARPTLVLLSTMPLGTSTQLARDVAAWADLIYAPPFLADHSRNHEFCAVDRILIGCDESRKCVPYVTLLERLQKPVIVTTFSNAELIASCANTYLAMSAIFANEVERLCHSLGATAVDVLRGVAYSHDGCGKYLRPGISLDASSLSEDVASIKAVACRYGLSHQFFSGILQAIDAQADLVVDCLTNELGLLTRKTIGVWGLVPTPGGGNVAGSQALRIVERLSDMGASTVVYDPAVQLAALPARSRLTSSPMDAATADALIVLNAWPEFSQIDPFCYAESLAARTILDTCNALDSSRVCAAGLHYRNLGRPEMQPHERLAFRNGGARTKRTERK